MVFRLGRDEWWLCQEQDCTEPDRASPLETQAWVRWRLQDLRTETGKMRLLQDLARHNISSIPLHLPHDALIRKIEQLFASDRLHVHKKRMEAGEAPALKNEMCLSLCRIVNLALHRGLLLS